MTSPFFPPEIGARLEQAPHLLLGLDFDGTLAPLVDDQALAELPPDTERVLKALAQQDGATLALISGRQRADLQERVGLRGVIYAGNHGLEISGDGFIFIEPTAVQSCETLTKLADRLTRKLQPIAGAFVEDKGLTLSIHYRRVANADRELVRRFVHEAVADAKKPVFLTMGNQVWEIRPHLRWHKGNAMRWIQQKIGRPDALVVYLGDDITDEDAFAELHDAITIKVGHGAGTAAQRVLEGPAAVRHFLECVNDLLLQKAAHLRTRQNVSAHR